MSWNVGDGGVCVWIFMGGRRSTGSSVIECGRWGVGVGIVCVRACVRACACVCVCVFQTRLGVGVRVNSTGIQ